MGIVGAFAVPHPPLIVPAVGRGREAEVQATIDAYRQVAREVVALEPETIVVSSPHAPMFLDAFHITTVSQLSGDLRDFAPDEEGMLVDCDYRYACELVGRASRARLSMVGSARYGGSMDHGTYIPLWFVREAVREKEGDASAQLPCRIVRVALSGLDYEKHRILGRCIAEQAEAIDRRTVYIASGDLSHKLQPYGPYGFTPEGPEFDAQICDIFSTGELERLFDFDPSFADAAAECGLRSFQIMAGALEGRAFTSELLSHEDVTGVGYGVAAFRMKD